MTDKQTKNQLNTVDEIWTLTFNAIDDIVTIQDENLRIVKANEAAHRFFQVGDGELVGKSCHELFADTAEPCLNCPLLVTLTNGHKHAAKIKFVHLGKAFNVTSAIIPADHSGKRHLVHVARDITGHIQAETALKESEECFTKAFESNPAPMIISDIRSGLFIDMNRQWAIMTGYSREELIGHTSLEANIWQDPAERDRMIAAFAEKGSIKEFPVALISKTGAIRSTLWSAEKITLGGEGAMLSIIYDFTDRLNAEKALRESEQKFIAAFEASPDAVNINRLEDGLYVNINRGFTDLTGFTVEDVQGRSSLDINIWADPADRQRLVKSLGEKGYCENLEAKFRRKDGSLTTALMSARVVSINNIAHIISITRDISELRRIEQTIIDQQSLFETMFNAIGDGVVITDTERRMQLVNRGMETTFGYLPEELQGQTTAMLYADADKYQLAGKKVFDKTANPQDHLYVTAYKDKSGREFPGETFGSKLYNRDNKWIGNLGIMRDISERLKGEAERDRLIAAVENTSDTVVITDPLGQIVYVNPAFETATGYSREEALGQNPRILQSGEQDEQFYADLWQTISSGRTFTGRMVNRRKDDSLYTEEATISPIHGPDGEIANYVAVKRDITAQIALEKQLQQAQKMEAVGRLTCGVAHDFNNILGVIIGYTQMALNQVPATDRLHSDLEKILDAAGRSADIVRQLLAFSRQQIITPKVLDLNNSVEKMLRILRRLIGEDIDLAWLPHQGLPPIKMDPAQIDQILANLCVNARDAIKGTGKVTIETGMAVFDARYCADHVGFLPGKFVQLAISDDGCGIDKDNLQQIFEPFFTTKELGRGTGLGLSTVYGIIKQNQGFINVYSEKDNGTTIKIYFPPCTDAIVHSPEVTATIIGAAHHETILLVEDDQTLLEMTCRMLQTLGYKVLTAQSPEAAIALADTHNPAIDLLLTDVVMPQMNGKQLADLMQSRYPSIKRLFMSGYTANVIAHRGVLDKGIHFIQKPFSRRDLAAKVREVIEKKME
jgi:PAS domain S-box-containing protein